MSAKSQVALTVNQRVVAMSSVGSLSSMAVYWRNEKFCAYNRGENDPETVGSRVRPIVGNGGSACRVQPRRTWCDFLILRWP